MLLSPLSNNVELPQLEPTVAKSENFLDFVALSQSQLSLKFSTHLTPRDNFCASSLQTIVALPPARKHFVAFPLAWLRGQGTQFGTQQSQILHPNYPSYIKHALSKISSRSLPNSQISENSNKNAVLHCVKHMEPL